MRKVALIAVSSLMLCYFLFVSGFIFEVTGNEKVATMDTPYTIAFSNDRLGFVGVFNEDDIGCAKWIARTEPKIPVYVDYLGMSLLIDYTEYTRGSYNEEHYVYSCC